MEWISVGDEMPEDGVYLVFAIIPVKTILIGGLDRRYSQGWHNYSSEEEIIITHWMPLPKYPDIGELK